MLVMSLLRYMQRIYLANTYKLINKFMLELLYIKLNSSRLFVNKFFCLSSACLLNEPKTKAQVWLIYKQTNMNKLFIKPSPSCS